MKLSEKTFSMGAGHDKLFEASSAMVVGAIQVYEIDTEK